MEETYIYKENTFGLKTLHEQERIFKHSKDGEHLAYGPDYIQEIIVPALMRWADIFRALLLQRTAPKQSCIQKQVLNQFDLNNIALN